MYRLSPLSLTYGRNGRSDAIFRALSCKKCLVPLTSLSYNMSITNSLPLFISGSLARQRTMSYQHTKFVVRCFALKVLTKILPSVFIERLVS